MLPLVIALAASLTVIDGDTFDLADGERIRVLGIDAPELYSPRCDRERELAEAATHALTLMLGDGESVALTRVSRDTYGRTLAWVTVEGRDVGRMLLQLGLAQEWRGRRANWCDGQE